MGWARPGSVCTKYIKQVMETIMAVSFIQLYVIYKEMQAFSSATACHLVCTVSNLPHYVHVLIMYILK